MMKKKQKQKKSQKNPVSKIVTTEEEIESFLHCKRYARRNRVDVNDVVQ